MPGGIFELQLTLLRLLLPAANLFVFQAGIGVASAGQTASPSKVDWRGVLVINREPHYAGQRGR